MMPPTSGNQPSEQPHPQPQAQPPYPAQPVPPAPSMPPAVPTQPTTTTISPALLAQAVRQAEQEKSRRKWGRRAILGIVGVGACCAIAEAAPFAVRQVGLYTKQQLDDALAAGIQQGREQVLAELRNLEGVALSDAVTVADLTRRGITNYVKPLADEASKVAGDALGAMAGVVGFARDHVPDATVLGVNVHDTLDLLQQLLSTWDQTVSSDPLGTYAVQDVTQAEAYLKALQRTISDSGNATPTPGS
jgi:hypothetical protein